ncbi:hypothetical protein GGR57DRAFT_468009 [Xylariaceae sp. FL1272]|nr:hypothetical protein GGR57DRAFT_468009 [Xylariaceae sp. FL1272]
MQALWSRTAAAQPSCSCRICLHTNAVVRRSTSAAARRRVTGADLITACYTTIIGSAVFIDARHKNERRRELDDRLGQAREAVKHLPITTAATTAETQATSPPTATSTSTTPTSLEYAPTNRFGHYTPVFDRIASPPGTPRHLAVQRRQAAKRRTTFTIPNEVDLLDFDSDWHKPLASLHDDGGNWQRPIRQQWLQDQCDWVDIEAQIMAEEQDAELELREPKNQDQLARSTFAVVDLVDKLLQQNWKDGLGCRAALSSTASGIPSNKTQHGSARHSDMPDKAGVGAILPQVQRLQASGEYPAFALPEADLARTASVREQLNRAMRSTFTSHLQSNLSKQASSGFDRRDADNNMLGKVCHNLLVASVPPTIHTYNILILGFHRAGRPGLANAVIESYLDRTRWPATSATIRCLLAHYRATNNIDGFRRMIRRMKGREDDGMHHGIFNRTYQRDDPSVSDFLDWAHKYCTQRKHGWVVRTQRNDQHFLDLEKTWLHFGELAHACNPFIAWLRDSSAIRPESLLRLLRACVAESDAGVARKLVAAIVRHFDNFSILLRNIFLANTTHFCREVVWHLQELLAMCWGHHGEYFKKRWKKYSRGAERLRQWLPKVDIELQVREYTRLQLAPTLHSILNTDEPLSHRLENAIRHLDKAPRKQQASRPSLTKRYAQARQEHIRISINARFADIEEKTRWLMAATRSAIIYYRTGYQMDPEGLLLREFRTNKVQRHHQLAVAEAVHHIDITRPTLNRQDLKDMLLARFPIRPLARQLIDTRRGDWPLTANTLASFFDPEAISRAPRDSTAESRKHGALVEKITEDALQIEDEIRAVLFASLSRSYTKAVLAYDGGYYGVSLEQLVGYHIQGINYNVAKGWIQPPAFPSPRLRNDWGPLCSVGNKIAPSLTTAEVILDEVHKRDPAGTTLIVEADEVESRPATATDHNTNGTEDTVPRLYPPCISNSSPEDSNTYLDYCLSNRTPA